MLKKDLQSLKTSQVFLFGGICVAEPVTLLQKSVALHQKQVVYN
jgi:hypothetical protein